MSHGFLASLLRVLWFEFRATGLRLRRGLQNLLSVDELPLHPRQAIDWKTIIGKNQSPLWTRAAAAEMHLVAGKIQNLRIASTKLDGLVIPAGATFSFWSLVGRPSRGRGFVEGRELREGCMIASVGGGLCQLSNALYAAALEAGLEIVERHAHTRVVPGSAAAAGRDATVFWNYKDLRFRATVTLVMDVKLSATHLIVQFRAEHSHTPLVTPQIDLPTPALETAEDCVACHHRECVYHPGSSSTNERMALLLDESWPEFDVWFGTQSINGRDIAFVPLDGARRGRPAYSWFHDAKDRPAIREHLGALLRRSWRLRRLHSQGAARQRALLRFDAELAGAYSGKIPFDSQRLIVSLNLLPHLDRAGALGGRHVTVFLTRSPLFLLHRQLDAAALLYPRSKTIADFRADAALVDCEYSALARADMLLTPHAMVAEELRRAGFPRVQVLPWSQPRALAFRRGKTILFPASGLARKGAYEIREAAREMNLPIAVLGRAQEDSDFWDSIAIAHCSRGRDLFRDIACVVLPSHVEHQPRILLQALASGVPVICSRACGLPAKTAGVEWVEPGNVAELRRCLDHVMSGGKAFAVEGRPLDTPLIGSLTV